MALTSSIRNIFEFDGSFIMALLDLFSFSPHILSFSCIWCSAFVLHSSQIRSSKQYWCFFFASLLSFTFVSFVRYQTRLVSFVFCCCLDVPSAECAAALANCQNTYECASLMHNKHRLMDLVRFVCKTIKRDEDHFEHYIVSAEMV